MAAGTRFPRPGTPADAPELARLRYAFRRALAAPVESEGGFLDRCSRWMTERLSRAGAWQCWVVDAAQPVGLAGTIWLQTIEKIPNPLAEPERHGYLTNLYVRPELRGAGIGTALLAASLERCDAEALDAVLLWPSPESRALYERHGFAVRDDLLERRRAPSA